MPLLVQLLRCMWAFERDGNTCRSAPCLIQLVKGRFTTLMGRPADIFWRCWPSRCADKCGVMSPAPAEAKAERKTRKGTKSFISQHGNPELRADARRGAGCKLAQASLSGHEISPTCTSSCNILNSTNMTGRDINYPDLNPGKGLQPTNFTLPTC